MKKLLYAGLLLLSLPAAAQSIRIIPEIGLQMSNQTWKEYLYSSPSGPVVGTAKVVGNVRPGLRAGISIDAPLSRFFFVQPGIFYSQRGMDDLGSTFSARVDYVEIPVNLLLKAPLGKGRLFIGGGPFVAFGVGGKFTQRGVSTDIVFGDNIPSNYKRFDAGLNFCGGFQAANGVILRGFVHTGLTNIRPAGTSDQGIRNWGYGFSIGYLIR